MGFYPDTSGINARALQEADPKFGDKSRTVASDFSGLRSGVTPRVRTVTLLAQFVR
jgi:hypothetical protein